MTVLLWSVRAEIDSENAAQNGGVNVCVDCGQEIAPEKIRKRGKPPRNERQRDHIVPQGENGDGSPKNG